MKILSVFGALVCMVYLGCNAPTESDESVPVRYTIDIRDEDGVGIDSVKVVLIASDEKEYVVYSVNGGKSRFSPINSHNNQFEVYKNGYISETFSDRVSATDSTESIIIKIIPRTLQKLPVDSI